MKSHEAERDDEWDRLLVFLNTLGSAHEVAPGQISLNVRGSDRNLEIVMTPEEWVDMVSIPWGNFPDAAEDVRRMVLSAGDDERYLVYADYQLEPSPTPDLPPDPEEARLQAMLKENGGKAIGSWVVLDDEGRVIDRFSDFSDDPQH